MRVKCSVPVQRGCCTVLAVERSCAVYRGTLPFATATSCKFQLCLPPAQTLLVPIHSLRLPLSHLYPASDRRTGTFHLLLYNCRTKCTKFSLRHWNCIIYVCVNFIRLCSFFCCILRSSLTCICIFHLLRVIRL
jgi:hypothetical protein